MLPYHIVYFHCVLKNISDRLPRLLRNVSSKQLTRPHRTIQNDVRQSSQATSTSMNQEFIDVSDEVKSAIADGKPVVTLESAIITHGMPTPTNAETAMKVQDIVREQVSPSLGASFVLVILTLKIMQTFLFTGGSSCHHSYSER